MKANYKHFTRYCLDLVLMMALAAVVGACSPTTVTPTSTPTPTLSSIAVTPASPANLAVGSTQQFTATGTNSDASNTDITSQVTWASSNASVATISSAGVATGVAVGSTNVTSSMSGVTGPAITLMVVSP